MSNIKDDESVGGASLDARLQAIINSNLPDVPDAASEDIKGAITDNNVTLAQRVKDNLS
jgi:osmotically-inducible protein OsmY